MSHDRTFRMNKFQCGLYRHYVNAQRHHDKKHGLNLRVTRIVPDKDDPSKASEQAVEFDRTLPLNIAGIARILRVHTLVNRGEVKTQALRVIAALDDQGEQGVLAAVIDRLYGMIELRFRYRSWDAAELGPGTRRIADLLRPDEQPIVLTLYRLCELLDADQTLGAQGYHRAFIADALQRPEGAGFPNFTKGPGRELLERIRAAEPAARSGVPEGLRDGAWYAMDYPRFSHEPLDSLRFFIGQAYTHKRSLDDWHFREGGISVVAENEGCGRIVPSHEILIYEPWISAGRRMIPVDAEFLARLKAHVERPFQGTSKLMAACLKTV